MKERLEYIDWLKGLAMLLVLVGHVIVFCGLGYDNVFIKHITMMNMPLFFFLNGLVLKDLVSINKGKFLLKKFTQTILPFLCWGGVLTLFKNKMYLEFFQDYWKFGYWYLLVLFEFLLFYVILSIVNEKINKKELWWLDLLVFGCIWLFCSFISRFIPEKINGIIDYWQFIGYLPFFYLGHFINKYKLSDIILRNTSLVVTVILLIIVPCYILWRNEICLKFINLILPTIIILLLFTLFMNEDKSNCDKSIVKNTFLGGQLSIIGKHTMSIYMIQFFLFRYINLNGVLNPLYNGHNYLLIIIICMVISVLLSYICIIVESILSKSRFLNFVLFGRK